MTLSSGALSFSRGAATATSERACEHRDTVKQSLRTYLLALILLSLPTLSWSYPGEGVKAGEVFSCQLPRAHERFEGRVVRVIDADTVVMATRSCSALHVRFADFDAPELSQRPAGPRARAVLVNLAAGKWAVCKVTRGRSGYASYGRAMARCWVAGRSLGDGLRAAGVVEGGR